MLISDYIQQALRTAAPMHDQAGELEHAALGLITELGELATEVKRLRIYLKPIDRVHAAEEIGDVLWYWAIAANRLLDLGVVSFAGVQADLNLTPGVTTDVYLSRGVRRLAANVGEFSALIETGSYEDAAERLHDTLMCLAAVCCVLNLNLQDCAAANIEKLRVRFPNKFTEADAEARADKGGLDARVS